MSEHPWSPPSRVVKRTFDLLLASVGLLVGFPVILLACAGAWVSTGEWAIYSQVRIGRGGRPFTLYKVRTMRSRGAQIETTVTTRADPRITRFGRFLRATKIDEFPQLVNVIRGEMSFVGPRPDVPGFADRLTGDNRLILAVRPGITGPATLKYRNEEDLLAAHPNPETFNRTHLFPDKVRMNLDYVRSQSLFLDLGCILCSVVPLLSREVPAVSSLSAQTD